MYPAEHYDLWRAELPELSLIEGVFGAFGENFTTRGLHEDEVHIGDRFRVGSAEVQVTEPRMPCAKLAVRFQRKDMTKRFLRSGRTGRSRHAKPPLESRTLLSRAHPIAFSQAALRLRRPAQRPRWRAVPSLQYR